MPVRGRRSLIALVAGLGLLTAGCTSAITGHGRTVGLDSPSAVGPVPLPSAATRAAEARTLVGLLEPRPIGAATWSGSWARDVTPTVGQWAHRIYGPPYVGFNEDQVRAQGIVAIAHRTWVARDGNQVDIMLLGFTSVAGATSRWLSATHEQSISSDVSVLPIRGDNPAVRGYYHPELDDEGNVRADVYSHRGRVECEIFAFTPRRLRQPDIDSWSMVQLRRLPG